MVYEGGYAVLLVLHLLAVVFLVGPLALAAVHAPGQVRAGNVAGVTAAARTTRLYSRLTLVVVALGALMVADRWQASSAWVLASYAVWFVAVAVHLSVVQPALDRALDALTGGGDATGEVRTIAVGAGLATAAWVVLVVLMVVKPGL